MNTSELVTKIAEANSVSKAQAQAIVDSMLKSIMSAAANGEEISLAGSAHRLTPVHSHADELPDESVRRSRSERSWQSGRRKTPLRAIADAMRA